MQYDTFSATKQEHSLSSREEAMFKQRINELDGKIAQHEYKINKLRENKKAQPNPKNIAKINFQIRKIQNNIHSLQARKQQIITELNHRQSIGFDDELMQNMETTDILMTDTTYTPPSQIEDTNNFRRDVLNNIKNIKYNPTKEKQKYSYDKLEQMRSERL